MLALTNGTGTSVELWMEGSNPQLRVHTPGGIGFAAVKAELVAMRDRLSLEIEAGPTRCPFSPDHKSLRMPTG